MTTTTMQIREHVENRLRQIKLDEQMIVADAQEGLAELKAEREQLVAVYEAASPSDDEPCGECAGCAVAFVLPPLPDLHPALVGKTGDLETGRRVLQELAAQFVMVESAALKFESRGPWIFFG